MAFLFLDTVCTTAPLEACMRALGLTRSLFMTSSSQDSKVPEEVSRETATIWASSPPRSFQLVILPAKMSRSCSTVSAATLLAGLTTGTMASMAMGVRRGVTPFLAAASTSLALMSRELMAMSHCFSSRALMPLPEPPPEMLSSVPGWEAMNASPAFCTTGKTVVEPLMTTCWAAMAGAPRQRTVRAAASSLPLERVMRDLKSKDMGLLLLLVLCDIGLHWRFSPAATLFWPCSVTE